MVDPIATEGVHHVRLTVSNVDRTVTFFTELLGFKKLMDLNPGAFLSNGRVGLGIGPHPDPSRAISGDRFDENRIGLDHLSFGAASRADLEHAVRVLDQRGISHSEIRDLGAAFGILSAPAEVPDREARGRSIDDLRPSGHEVLNGLGLTISPSVLIRADAVGE